MVHRPAPVLVEEPGGIGLPAGLPPPGDPRRFECLVSELVAEYEQAKFGSSTGSNRAMKTFLVCTSPRNSPRPQNRSERFPSNESPHPRRSDFQAQVSSTGPYLTPEQRWGKLTKRVMQMRTSDGWEPRECWQYKAWTGHTGVTATTSVLSGREPDLMQTLWIKRRGNIMRGHADSHFTLMFDSHFSSFVVHPDSLQHLAWAFFGLLFFILDIFFFTMSVFGLERPFWVALLDCIYWSVDIVFNFRLGYHSHDRIVTDFSRIARTYMRRWFIFDVSLMVAGWCTAFLEVGGPGTTMFRYFRLVRLTRLFRISKFASSMHKLALRVQTDLGTILLKTVVYMVAVGIWIHTSACLFYWIGDDPDGWTRANTAYQDPALKYIISVHWAASQLQGGIDIYPATTVGERTFAVLNLLGSIAVLAMVVSKITTLLGAIQVAQRDRNRMFNTARRFVDQHNVRPEVSLEVYRYLSKRQRYQVREDEASAEKDLFMRLPFQLRRRLLEEARWPHLNKRIVFVAFSQCSKQFQTQLLCDVLQTSVHLPDHLVFQYGAMCPRVYIITSGDGHYTRYARTFAALLTGAKSVVGAGLQASEALTRMISEASDAKSNTTTDAFQLVESRHRQLQGCNIFKGVMLCESAFWTNWSHVGDFEAVGELNLFTINVSSFIDLVASFSQVQKNFRSHAARFAQHLQRLDELSDLICSEQIMSNAAATTPPVSSSPPPSPFSSPKAAAGAIRASIKGFRSSQGPKEDTPRPEDFPSATSPRNSQRSSIRNLHCSRSGSQHSGPVMFDATLHMSEGSGASALTAKEQESEGGTAPGGERGPDNNPDNPSSFSTIPPAQSALQQTWNSPRSGPHPGRSGLEGALV